VAVSKSHYILKCFNPIHLKFPKVAAMKLDLKVPAGCIIEQAGFKENDLVTLESLQNQAASIGQLCQPLDRKS
jgi:hypothetical protein